mmetsp:Transcript_42847/g.133788  ORF Transcript_42847/g.133788 Transcript_42847/m.133788 type:complete len:249 (+) Transcript_42847:83-829(+)
MAVKDASPGLPAAEAGNREQESDGVREIAGFPCMTKSTFLHVVAQPPVLINRRPRLAPPSTSSSSAGSKKSDSSHAASISRMLPDRTGSDDDCEGSDLDDDDNALKGSPSSGQAGRVGKRPRACKGKRDRYKHFVRFVEASIRKEPDVDLLSFNIPGFIQRDDRMYARMMHRLALVKEKAMGRTRPPNAEGRSEAGEGVPAGGSTPRAAAKRAASPFMRGTEPEAKRAAGPGRRSQPRRSSPRNVVSL